MFRRFVDRLRSLWYNNVLEIAVLGVAGAGKSTLVTRLCEGTFIAQSAPTIGFSVQRFRKGRSEIRIWDTAGQLKYRSVWSRYARSSTALIYCIDSSDRSTWKEAGDELMNLLSTLPAGAAPTSLPALLLVATKVDLPGAERQPARILEGLELGQLPGVRMVGVLATSALSGEGVTQMGEWLRKYGGKK